jgi:hypothetical protein
MNRTQVEGKKARSVEAVYDESMTGAARGPANIGIERRFSAILSNKQKK